MAPRRSRWRLLVLAVISGCAFVASTSPAQAVEPKVSNAVAEPAVDVLIVNLNLSAETTGGSEGLAAALQTLSPGLRTAIVHYPAFTRAELERRRPRAVVLSPQGDPWWTYPKEALERLGETVRRLEVPVLGVCGGHQFLAIAFGGRVAPISGEAGPEGYASLPREVGWVSLRLVGVSPLFDGLKPGQVLSLRENHAEEVKQVPKDFDVFVEGDASRIQAMHHRTRPIYGVQFHPERYDDEHPDGRRVLEGFLRKLDANERAKAGRPGEL